MWCAAQKTATGGEKIRFWLFSDLGAKTENSGYAWNIHMPGICIGKAYAYIYHMHMVHIYICGASAYT